MDGAMASLRHEFAVAAHGPRLGLDAGSGQVDAYGQLTPINQVGTVNVPEPRMVTINVWDKGWSTRPRRRSANAGWASTRR